MQKHYSHCSCSCKAPLQLWEALRDGDVSSVCLFVYLLVCRLKCCGRTAATTKGVPSYLSDEYMYKSASEASRHASYRCPELVWATGRLMSPDRGFGTSCLHHCGRLTVSANSEDSWKRVCLSRTRLWHLVTHAFRRRIQILLLTYLYVSFLVNPMKFMLGFFVRYI